ncbi:DUF192 domain-containing protein [Streptomyces sp. NPDC008265]|uniref:DUF192 domain-containing protein n=1 Tax=unclassified Streptomyces TaxID=2593676 RepID=UPI0036E1F733
MAHWHDGPAVLRIGADPGAAPREVPREVACELACEVPLEIAASYRARTRGLLGRDGIAGAMLLTPAASVHTFGMRFAIDVAHLDRGLRVLSVVTMRPGRIGLPRPRARHVLEAAAGSMAGWGLVAGAVVEVDLSGRLTGG